MRLIRRFLSSANRAKATVLPNQIRVHRISGNLIKKVAESRGNCALPCGIEKVGQK